MQIATNRPGPYGAQMLKVMKITAVLLLAACLQVSAKGYSQKLTLNLKNVSLEKVFKEIKRQSGYLFLYKTEELKKAGKVSVHVINADIDEALSQSLSSTGFTYKIIDRTIVLNPMAPAGKIVPAFINVQGKVTDAGGMPLSGATVKVRGKKTGTTTNQLGVFSLNGVDGSDVLEISFVGYETEVVALNSRTNITVAMSLSNDKLDETVIIGYGKTSKRLNTGSVASVTSEAISNQPVSDPIAAIQGRVSGLMIQSSNGLPGSSFKVRIRGENSLSQGNEPLYIIDGVPFLSSPINLFDGANGQQSPLNSINPNDIERIDVLKDADAAAIYGSRAANGVVLITTKKGKAGEGRVNVNVYSGISKVSNRLELLNTEQYLQLRKEAFLNDGLTPDANNAPDLVEWDQKAHTDWQDLLIGNTAKLTDAQLSFSGGNAQTRFLASGSFRRETTVLPGSMAYLKGGAYVSADHTSKDGKMGISASFNYSRDKNNSIPTDVTQYFYMPPNYPLYNPDGSLYWWGTMQNPLGYLKRTYETGTNNLIGNSVLRYTVIPGLDIKTNLGITQTSMRQTQTLPAAGFNPATYNGSSSQFGNASVYSYIVEPQATYSVYAGPGRLNLLAGASWQQSISEGQYVQGTGYSSDALLKDISSAGTLTARNSYNRQYKYQSVFGRINYNLNQKYILNLTFRRDGSSRFGPNRQFGNFGAVGAAWLFSNEALISKALPFISYGKLRASFGTTGNDQIGDYQYLDSWSPTSFPYGGVTGLSPTSIFNPDYSWETNKKFEAAIELGFLSDRILFTANYYNNRSSNQLVGYTLSPQAGFSEYIANFPAKVENSGWEFDVSSAVIESTNFQWNTSFNLTLPKNKLLEYPDLESSSDAAGYEVGQSIRVVKGFHFTGIDPQTGIPQFLDVDKDGSISDPDDYVPIGQTMPSFFGGLSNRLHYKNWGLNFFFQFVKQEAPTMDYGPLVNAYGTMNNAEVSVLDRWTTAGATATLPRATANTSNAANMAFRNYYRYSDAAWGDASYIRLKNLALSYDLTSLTKKWNIEGSSIYLQAQNLLTFTNYKGLDPEVNGFDRRFVYPVNPFGSVKS
ncbi:MAG TPA: SusC/RagA family TonB-linked outer membrane protein, partial [Chitinophagaceae bacterium]|nr:SusC/RagA family TonB-linked outer membrane protein [Chitinophagaceae bacterium]